MDSGSQNSNYRLSTRESKTILDTARDLGIHIPTLGDLVSCEAVVLILEGE